MKCPKCDGEMEEGFMLDSGFLGTAIPQQQVWVNGKELTLLGNDRQIPVKSNRCKICGFIESYAK